MKLLFAAGTGLAVLATFAAMFLVVLKIAYAGFVVHGFTALAVLVLFSCGSTLAGMGLVGLYLGKVFIQAKQRPVYIIREEL